MQTCRLCQIRFHGAGALCLDCRTAGAGSGELPVEVEVKESPRKKATRHLKDLHGDSPNWWKHVLVRDGADPLLLTQGQAFRFGRHESCDLQIASRKASRYHAQIDWAGTQAEIVDLDSNNGTYVNDKRVSRHRLKDGDEIRVATTISVYRKVHNFEELEEDEADSGALTTAGMSSMFSGQLQKTPLLEVLQAIAHEGDTGTISVLPRKGRIGCRLGEPIFAYAQDLEGEEALLSLLVLESGMFVFNPVLETAPRNINRSFTQILSGALERGIKPPREGAFNGFRKGGRRPIDQASPRGSRRVAMPPRVSGVSRQGNPSPVINPRDAASGRRPRQTGRVPRPPAAPPSTIQENRKSRRPPGFLDM